MKMSLQELPEEILRLILLHLDVTSLRNLYETNCLHIQHSICAGVRKLDISCSTMATTRTLYTSIFKNIAACITELVLKGVPDLAVASLMPVLRSTEKLVTLNVAYTSITLKDFMDLYDQCPTIRNITIDLKMQEKGYVPKELVSKCQNVFSKMKIVTFVGSEQTLLKSPLPTIILKDAKLKSLTFTVMWKKRKSGYFVDNDDTDTFSNIFVPLTITSDNVNVISEIKTSGYIMLKTLRDYYIPLHMQYEIIYFGIADYSDCMNIVCTPLLESFFVEHFRNQSKRQVFVYSEEFLSSDTSSRFYNCYAFMFWDKLATEFDDKFFQKLLDVINNKLSCIVDSTEKDPKSVTFDRIIIKHKLKTRRDYFDNPIVAMDYDDLLIYKEKVQIRMMSVDTKFGEVTISPNSNFLNKLTYLRLCPEMFYGAEFFDVLFKYCENIRTLIATNVFANHKENTQFLPFHLSIPSYVGQSRSLQNLLIMDFIYDYSALYSIRCKSLQNLVIINLATYKHHLLWLLGKNIENVDDFLEFSENLYNLSLVHGLRNVRQSDEYNELKKRLSNKKERCSRHHLRIHLCRRSKKNVAPSKEVFQWPDDKLLSFGSESESDSDSD